MPPAQETRVTRRRPWSELAALRELRRTGRLAAVICGVWYPEGLLATLAGVRPRVILAHGLELRPTRARWRRRLWRVLMGLVLRRADLVVANSNYTAALVRAFAPGAPVAALPLGVDHLRFRPGDRDAARRHLALPADKRVVVTISRLILYKGHSLVFKALAAMPAAAREEIVYVVAGQGRDMVALRAEAQALGLGRVVRWLGYVPEPDLLHLYQSADLFVLCPREDPDQPDVEGFGLVFLEAQACGVPVVGTRTGGIPDAIKEGCGGWLIDQDDVGALTVILARLAEDLEGLHEMGRAARQQVEGACTLERYLGGFVDLLERHEIALR